MSAQSFATWRHVSVNINLIVILDSSKPAIELSDGWYSVPCVVDQELFKLIQINKIIVGQKLAICNATISGTDGCHPLENTSFFLSMYAELFNLKSIK